jgi:tRNA threonylcarbamoyladenosine biosynthesis protein TsaB
MNRIAAHRSASDGSADSTFEPLSDATRHPSARPPAENASARTCLLVVDTSTDACSVAVCVPLPLPASTSLSPPNAVPGPDSAVAAPIATAWPEITIRDDIVAGVRIVACWRRTGAVSSEALLPMVQAVLDAADITLQACGAIAFGAGPGSFTGVRTATGAAQGLAFANDMPVVPLDTLMACAESARLRAPAEARPVRVYVAVDARMGECYAAAFSWCDDKGIGGQKRATAESDADRHADAASRADGAVDRPVVGQAPLGASARGVSGGYWRVDIDAHVAPPPGLLTPPADWTDAAASAEAEASVRSDRSESSATPETPAASTARGFMLAGNALSVFGDALPLRALASACDDAAWPEPLALATLGWQRWQEGAALPAAMAQPRYIRDKVALTTQERLAVKEAKAASKEGGA